MKKYGVLALAICALGSLIYGLFLCLKPEPWTRKRIALNWGQQFDQGLYPNVLNDKKKSYQIEYTFDAELEAISDRILNSYKPDYAALSVIEADTGRVLLLKNYLKDGPQEGPNNMALKALFPAASIFKIITAAAAIDHSRVSPDTVIPYNGSNHTLYRKNVEATQFNKWTRYTSVKQAFGSSINTVFGKLGLFYVGPQILRDYASKFAFNENIESDLPFESGSVHIQGDNRWEVVETASGFTQQSTLSPLHGALIAGAIANDGKLMEPFVVEKIMDKDGEALYHATHKVYRQVVSPGSADDLKTLMRQTILKGTSRKTFRQVFRKETENLDVGGKTGSLDSNLFKGRTDWFIGYLNINDKKYSIGVVTVHKKYWTVKSSYLSSLILNHLYLKNIKGERYLLRAKAGVR